MLKNGLVQVFQVDKENTILGALYISLLALSLLAYLLTVVLRPEGYNPGIYRDAYVYFMVFDFILFSLFIAFWDVDGVETREVAHFLKLLAGITVMALSSVPLVLTIFMTARLYPFNFVLPLLMKPAWGLAVLCLKSLISALKPGWRWTSFALALFIFSTLALGSLLAFFSVEYRQAVITTLYDRDIGAVFFLNPLLSLAGLVYAQAGGGSQMGHTPFYACALFWGLASVILFFCTGRITVGRGRRPGHE